MKKAIIFGAGGMGQAIYKEIRADKQVVMFWDNGADEGAELENIPIKKPDILHVGG